MAPKGKTKKHGARTGGANDLRSNNNHCDSNELTDMLDQQILSEVEAFGSEDSFDDGTPKEDYQALKEKILDFMEIKHKDGNMEVTLEHTYNNERIEIVFNAENYVEYEDDIDEEDEEAMANLIEKELRAGASNPAQINSSDSEDDENEDDDDDDSEDFIEFVVRVHKQEETLEFTCRASTYMKVDEIRRYNAENKEEKNRFDGIGFEDLGEELQEGFRNYLKERHVDDDLAMFISHYSERKQHHEEISFLRDVQRFLSI